jgi:5-methylcytosine-specific restriction enzyme A
MGIIAYWKYINYLRDTQDGFTFHFNSNQSRLHNITEIGEDVFAISGVRTTYGYQYFLLAHLIIKAKTLNAPGYKYGKYRIWGDEKFSKYFELKPFTQVLTKLQSIKHFKENEVQKYSQAFQTIRKLNENDLHLIKAFAQTLNVHPKTKYRFPEKEYEESLNQDSLLETIVENQDISPDSKGKLIRRVSRNRILVKELNELYGGRCQICSFDPLMFYGKPLCVAHHITYISREGDDSLENLVLVCPNCHEALHKSDAVFDFKDLVYRYDNGRVSPLVINHHLKPSA